MKVIHAMSLFALGSASIFSEMSWKHYTNRERILCLLSLNY